MKSSCRATKYKKHIFKYVNEIIEDLEKEAFIDMKRMNDALKPALINLIQNGFNKLKNITKLLKHNGFKSNDIKEIIKFLEQYLEKDKISLREIMKLNRTYQNVILNSLFYKFPDESFRLIDEYVSKNCPFVENYDNFMIEIKNKIQKMQKNQSVANNFDNIIEITESKFISNNDDYDEMITIKSEDIDLNAAAESINDVNGNFSYYEEDMVHNSIDHFIEMSSIFDLNSLCFYF